MLAFGEVLSNDRDVSFGKIGASTGEAVLLAGCAGVLFLSSSLLSGFVFVASGVVRARTKLLVPPPMACIVATFVQRSKSRTQFMKSLM